MLQTMRQLIRVRDVDQQIAEVDRQLKGLPEEREAIEGELLAAREALARAKESLENQEVEERRLERELREQETLIERLNAQSAQVTSSQAYQALKHELESASAASSEFETRALELMEAIDRVREEVASAEERLERAEERTPVQLDEISARERRLAAEREQLFERRQEECQGVDAAVLAHYERVAQQRRPAVGILEGQVCPECGIAVPTQKASEIRRARAVHACNSCHRLLVPVQALSG